MQQPFVKMAFRMLITCMHVITMAIKKNIKPGRIEKIDYENCFEVPVVQDTFVKVRR